MSDARISTPPFVPYPGFFPVAYNKVLPNESLKDVFHSFMRGIPGVQQIDEKIKEPKYKHAARNTRIADYLLGHRKIIVEVKEVQADRGRHIDRFGDLARAAAISNERLGPKMVVSHMGKLTHADAKKWRHLLFKVTAGIEQNVSDADKQTAGTKKVFELPDHHGVLIILNSRSKVMLPHLIYDRVGVLMDQKFGDRHRFIQNKGFLLINQGHAASKPNDLQVFIDTGTGPSGIRSPLGYLNKDALVVPGLFQDKPPAIGHFLAEFTANWLWYCERRAKGKAVKPISTGGPTPS